MLDSGEYLGLLSSKIMGKKPSFMERTGSTNDWIAARLDLPGVGSLVAAAESQTEGRGRMGRVWSSPEGVNLAFSLAWLAPKGMANPGQITLVAGVALAEAVESVCSITPVLKYPNDLLINGKKMAGILTEFKSGSDGKYAVIGVGVNVNTQISMLPGELAGIATSITEQTGEQVSRERILATFINLLEPALEMLANRETKDIMERYRRLASSFFGSEVTVRGAGEEFTGIAVGVDDDGALMVTLADGEQKRVTSGEMSFEKIR